MKLYAHYFGKYKWGFFAAVICVALEALCDLMGPTLMSHIINEGIGGGSVSAVYFWGLRMILITALGAVFAASRNILASRTSQSFGAELRYDLFKKILSLRQESCDRLESGSLIIRMTGDVTQLTQFANGTMRIFFKAPLTCLGSIVLASMLNLRMSVIVYSLVAVVGVLLFISMRLSHPAFRKLQKSMDALNTAAEEYLMGVRLVKAFGTYDEETERFEIKNTDLYKKGVRAQIVITLISPILTLAVGFATGAALLLGSRLFGLGLTQPGQISAFIVYMTQILSSLMMITNIFNTFVRTRASVERVSEVLSSADDFEDIGASPKIKGGVEFKNVTFSYPGSSGLPSLKNLSFKVEPGERIAIIGPTGSGKSTIAWLLMRLYDVTDGEILVDGIDIRDIKISDLRGAIAPVPQKATLFSGTVRDNVNWADPSAPDERTTAALKAAEANFVFNMKKGADSLLGSGGVNVSGGQKQRISIARALMKDAPILILDDATSALDPITEKKVKQNISGDERTVMLITQRCSAAMDADKILVLNEGALAGLGKHEDLLETCPIYRDIYDSQTVEVV